jgi:hypothetical protein
MRNYRHMVLALTIVLGWILASIALGLVLGQVLGRADRLRAQYAPCDPSTALKVRSKMARS